MSDTTFKNCPKCSYKLNNTVECEKCGLILNKYTIAQAKKKDQQKKDSIKAERKKRGLKRIKWIAIVTAIICTIVFIISKSEINISEVIDTVAAKLNPSDNTPNDNSTGLTETKSINTEFLEHAKQATVSVEGAWGSGSGFFITPNHIVTNKHVVEFNEEEYEEYKRDIERGREILELEAEKIQELKQKYEELPDGPAKKQLGLIIEKKEEDLSRALEKHETHEIQLEEIEENMLNQNMRIVLYDGSEHQADFIETSEDHDLALITIQDLDWTHLLPHPNEKKLKQGDTVYTIGSPVGLRNTITSGILSGYRWVENVRHLQTDAPINPGNSGGPLIDDEGFVHGVNTFILQDTEGIGFAIPIELVFNEFGSEL